MSKIDSEMFNSPRYRITWVGNGYRSYLDQETGIGYCVPVEERKYSTNSLLDKNIPRNGNKMLMGNEYCDSSDSNNSVLDGYVDIIQLIIGISVAKGGFLKGLGAHAFIMYIIDPYNTARNWQQDIMLDASGNYGVKNSVHRKPNVDIVEPTSPTTISIDSYRRYFYGYKEILYIYSYIVDKTVGQNIKTLINNVGLQDGFGFFGSFKCADKASYILKQSGLFPGIKNTMYPIDIKRFCDKFDTVNKSIMDISKKASYDLEILPE